MKIKDFEISLKKDIETIFGKIIEDIDNKINLRVQSRAGAEISDIFGSFVNKLQKSI